MSVSRETLEALVRRWSLDASVAASLGRLLDALAAERSPPTAVRAPHEAIDVHVADSLSGLEMRELRAAGEIADLGSGAGFPGLVLAAALPRARVDLIESGARKSELIGRLAAAAGLANAVPVHARAEVWAAAGGRGAYAAVTARALAPLAVLVEYAAPLLRDGGALVAWKGARDAEEERAGAATALKAGLQPRSITRVEPFPGARNRHLHVFVKVEPTPERFPRRPGMAAKRPLA